MAEPGARGEAQQGFDRRKYDVNVAALGMRVAGLEGRVESLEDKFQQNTSELAANTRLTKQVHEVLHGRDDAPGIAGKVDEMHQVFAAAKGGFKVLEFAGKIAKPVALVSAAFVALGTAIAAGLKWPRF